MESVEAFLRAIRMYFIVGLVVAAVHSTAIHPPHGDTRWQRAVSVIGDVVSWPRFLVEASQTIDAVRIDQPPLGFSLLRRSEGDRGESP